MNFLGIIPARYESTRFPGKPLADINGKPMIQHVYEQASKALKTVYTATDDRSIEQAVKNFGGKVVMTSVQHRCGTERCAEAAGKIQSETGISYDVIINIQGDEPFIHPEQLEKIKALFDDNKVQIGTLIKPMAKEEDVSNPNIVKVVTDINNNALYFSRLAIPCVQNSVVGAEKTTYYHKHIGLYAYKSGILQQIVKLPPSPLEISESLEQLRWLENGYSIKTTETELDSYSIDTPDDLEKVIQKRTNF